MSDVAVSGPLAHRSAESAVIVFGGVFGLVEVTMADVAVVVVVAEVVAVPVSVIVDQQRLAADPQQAATERRREVLRPPRSTW